MYQPGGSAHNELQIKLLATVHTNCPATECAAKLRSGAQSNSD